MKETAIGTHQDIMLGTNDVREIWNGATSRGVMLGMSVFSNTTAINGAVLQMFNHGIVTGGILVMRSFLLQGDHHVLAGQRRRAVPDGLPAAAAVLRHALYMGADETILLTDRKLYDEAEEQFVRAIVGEPESVAQMRQHLARLHLMRGQDGPAVERDRDPGAPLVRLELRRVFEVVPSSGPGHHHGR